MTNNPPINEPDHAFGSDTPRVNVKADFIRLTPEQIEEKAQLVAKLMNGMKSLMQFIHEDDLELITKRAEVIDPKVFENFG